MQQQVVSYSQVPTAPTYRGGTNSNQAVPNFINKTYTIVDDPGLDKWIFWHESNDSFIINNSNEFAAEVLPKYFKHNNYSSFVRQMNMYDFHKTRTVQN